MIARSHSPAFSLLSDFDRANSAVDAQDNEARLKAAFEDGYRQGHAEARAEAEADAELLLAECRARHAEELAEEKQNWQCDLVDVLVSRLENATKTIARNIEERVAELLRPWLVDQLCARALQDLESAISRGLVEGAKIHIEAPAEIIQHLRMRLPPETFQIEYLETAGADVRAQIEDTEIELNMSVWLAELGAPVP